MKAVILWGLSLVAAAGAYAEGTNTPYGTIVNRNVFGLIPIPVVDPAALAAAQAEPPPKITPNGIMTIFGQLQVLFKVAVKPPQGQPQKDASYVMGVGERADDIEVVKIDEPAGIITFNNHGKVQEIPLVVAQNTSGPGPVPGGGGPAGGPPGNAGLRPPAMGGGGNSIMPAMGAAGVGPGGRKVTTGGNNQGTSGMPSFGGNATANVANNAQSGEQLSPEAQVIMIEAQRAEWLKRGNRAAAILPQTPLTPQVSGDNNQNTQ